jgi:hypothetical protein
MLNEAKVVNSDHFIDLDELPLRCRTDTAKKYVSEAVRSYKAGAFRGCVVMTWIAIVYDFVDKLRELELTGDRRAIQKLGEFDKCQGPANIERALKFEREILNAARDEFELISSSEYADLNRLQEDRHRCAHPSYAGSEPYQPSAELARLHLRNAVVHFLCHPPVQGKAALERLVAEVASEFFPATKDDALTLFSRGPLARPRESLVRNFVIITAKKLLYGKLKGSAYNQQCAALEAALTMHHEVVESVIAEKLSDLILGQPDSDLPYAMILLNRIAELNGLLRDDSALRLRTYVSKMNIESIPRVFVVALKLTPLRAGATSRIPGLSRAEVVAIVNSSLENPPPEIAERCIDLYGESTSFDSANSMVDVIIPLLGRLEAPQIDRLLATSANPQIIYSFRFRQIVEALRESQAIAPDELNKLLAQYHITDVYPDLLKGTQTSDMELDPSVGVT